MGNNADDTRWLDATAHARLVATREATATELCDAAISRVERLDGPINAVIMRWFDRAHRQAKAFDELPIASEQREAPFAGVPFLLKDLHNHVAGLPLTSGNRAACEATPLSTHDSNLVVHFRNAGLITLGRSNSPEFGSLPVTEPLAYGPTRNPWDTEHTPGGSSGGAAAAVAAGMVPIAHASDGGGSIRIPASCCGLVGLKPSQGRVSMGPERDESGLSTQLCVSRSVRDTARMLDAVHGPGVGDSVIAPTPSRVYVGEVGVDPGRLRIGLLDRHPMGGDLHPDCVAAVRSAAGLLEGLGHDVSLGHPPILEDAEFPRRFAAMWAALMAVGIDALGQTIGHPLTADEVEPVNWAQGEYAGQLSASQYAMALAAVGQYRRHVQGWWAEGWDLLLTPTLATPPLAIGGLYGEQNDGIDPDNPMAPSIRAGRFVAFTPQFNASGQPAISLPLHWNDAGLPIGVQLVAAYGREDMLIRIAAQLEAAAPWADRHPPT
ncbi:MAG TPA: amidase [Ilumatobacteraceae bacterium]|nr:amidase [Ilumatobacteraceae bacterium]